MTLIAQDLQRTLVNGVRCIAFKPDLDSQFLVGTEEGQIHLCSTEFSSQFLMTYQVHVTPINKIVWNPFYTNLFLSCASESRVFLWHRQLARPVLFYCLASQVTDVAWSDQSSTIFAVTNIEGSVALFDISINKYSPICRQVCPCSVL